MKDRARIEKYLRRYEQGLDTYENEHPHWRIEVLVSLIQWGLKSLRHHVEDPRERQVTWGNPFAELHYEVGWKWESRNGRDVAPGGHIFGEITPKDVANEAKANTALARIMVEQLNAMTLADATNWAWYEKRKNYYTPVFPIETTAKLNAIKSKRARREAFVELMRPFSIGEARVEASVGKLKSGQRVPRRMRKGNQPMDIPGIQLSGEINGRKFDIGLIFEIHPLIADYDQKKAYHPVVAGLAVLGGNARLVDGEMVQDTPADWPKGDREKFWEELLVEIAKITAALIPKAEAEGSVILSVNSQIKVPANCWSPEHRSATIKQIADLQSLAGELQDFRVHAIDSAGAQLGQPPCQVCGWIHDKGFAQIRINERDIITLRGILPDIVTLVHRAHEKGFRALSTKDDELAKVCGGYGNPCKAFDDLKHREDYKRLFDTSRRGFISIRGVLGKNRNKSESSPE